MEAYGIFLTNGAYLRDGWCQLDFILVSLAWLPVFVPSVANYSALRALRALRPLRALKRLPGMPILVQWILDVMPKMGNVLLLFGFMFLVFGIAGLELFQGSLDFRCALYDTGPWLEDGNSSYVDTGMPCDVRAQEQGGTPQCSGGAVCIHYPIYVNPSRTSSFDSIASAFITLAQSTTLDQWAPPMYGLMASFSPYVWCYFFLVVLVGGFFIVNLFLAVIFLEFGASRDAVQQAAELEAAARERFERRKWQEAGEDLSHADGSTDPMRQTLLGSGAIASDFDGAASVESFSGSGGFKTLEEERAHRNLKGCLTMVDGYCGLRTVDWLLAPPSDTPSRKCMEAVAASPTLSHAATAVVIINMVLMCLPYEGMPQE